MLSIGERLLLLVAVSSAVALIDFLRLRGKATRWKEYLYVASSGLLGGVLGICNDMLTSRISRSYFTAFKGIADTGNFREDVLILGFQAGIYAGIFLGIFILLANTIGPRPRLPFRYLWKLNGVVAAAAFLGGTLLGLAYFFFNPKFVQDTAASALVSDPHFGLVWGVHTGLYVGALLGVVWACVNIVRKRLFKGH